MTQPFRRLHDSHGFALVTMCLVLLVLVTLAAASTLYTTLDLRSTAHYDTGNRAFSAAEAGILHAISTMNQTGVLDFRNDIVNRWTTLYGSASKTMPSMPTLGYTVAVTADATSPTSVGTITSTGTGPMGAKRVIAVKVKKSSFVGSPGAIYLAADSVSSQFSGNAFEVDGNDHNALGDLVPTGPVMPGIATRNDSVNKEVTDSLSSVQRDNVRGLGFSMNPLTPSVVPGSGPSVSDLNQMISHLLSLPGVSTTSQKNFTGNATFGTTASPQITHLTNTDVNLSGTAQGAGILIADGSITISGTLDFIGWIIVRGETNVNATSEDSTWVQGNATILGALWTGDLNIKVGGSAIVDYCQSCLQMVDNIDSANGGATPRPMRVVSWQEVL